jgi:hypothetical protein
MPHEVQCPNRRGKFFDRVAGEKGAARSGGTVVLPPVPIIGETAYPLNLVCGAGRL